ncbi:MAG: ArnT family glycosyltransferase, partial [Solirubrobacteraceae bacterium]
MRLHRNRYWLAALVLIAVVIVSHGINMLHYPYLEDDEGTYFSQGWAVFHLGRLAPYTYFYDHTPIGWIQIAIWQLVTAGARAGDALSSGRVLMLLYQLGSASLVLAIGRRESGKTWVGLLAGLLFSLSTYGIFYHRRILLDNIATFWLLLSLYWLMGPVTLKRIWLSALAMGIAVLSKEVAVAAIPALAILAARQSPKPSRLFAVSSWLAITLAVCSIYPMIAVLKGEFFAAGSLLGGHHPHVSLLCSLAWQASRSSDSGLLSLSSGFWLAAKSWAHAEPLLVIGGTAAALISATVLRRRPVISMVGWTILCLWLFLGRGGVVLVFYVVPLLPLLALALAFLLHAAVDATRHRLPPQAGRVAAGTLMTAAVVGCAALAVIAYERSGTPLWSGHPVDAQVAAVRWVQQHVPPSSRLVIDNYMWTDLHAPPAGAQRFPNAHYYWKVGNDPGIRRGVFKDNWRNVDYVITTPQLISDTELQGFPVVTEATEHSKLMRSFNSGGWEIDIRQVRPDGAARL